MVFRRINALIARGHGVASQAEFTLELAKALLEDFQDGVQVKIHLDDHAAHKLLSHFFKGKGGDLPVSLSIDPTWDTLPGKVAEFIGGPPEYSGKKFSVPPGSTILRLEGGHKYAWDGHVFRYKG